ncbi:MAG: MarR family transcriptional regulator [Anaerolineae bacterium]|nr:MarR family transcriptional regulator [Anaerolineae bacterium]
MTDLLQAILPHLNRGDCPDDKWPDSKGDYWPLSPLRADRSSGSFSVGPKGYVDFATGDKGSLRQLAEKLAPVSSVAVLQCCTGGKNTPPPPLTLEAYAEAKALPVPFLEVLGVGTVHLKGRPALSVPYYDADGTETAARLRLSLTGKDRFRWRKGSKTMPYGLWRLDNARQAGYVVLVEGESDTQTLWYHDVPALGLPGASTWKAEWATYLEGLTVYVWQEPDDGGHRFAAKVGQSLPDARIITAPDGRKDISECHLLGEDVPALMQRLMAEARPYREIAAKQVSQEAAAAKARAGQLLTQPDILGAFAEHCRRAGLVGEERNAKLLYLVLTTRLLDRPVSAVVKGPSAGGKSFAVQTVLDAFPDSAYYALSSMSERALAYSQEPLSHRMLVLYEAAGMASDFGSYLLRTLLSEGRIRYETVEKTSEGLVPRLIERAGPTGAILTTTWASLHPENETRLLSLTVKDTTEQTAAVLATLADRANGKGPADSDLTPWHALQTWLELAGCRDVTIPYALDLASLCNPAAVRLRRDFGALLNLIKAHAILHQTQRERDAQGRIVATLADYAAVYELVADLVSEGVQATVSPTVRETVEAVVELSHGGEDPVSVGRLADLLGLDKSTVSRRVRVATELGYLVNLEDRRGKPARLLPGEDLPEEKPILPTPQTLAAVVAGGEGGVLSPPTTVQHCNTATDAAPFTPSAEWQDLPDGYVCPPGVEWRVNLTTGKNQARWPDMAARAEHQAAEQSEPVTQLEAPSGRTCLDCGRPVPWPRTYCNACREAALAAEEPL